MRLMRKVLGVATRGRELTAEQYQRLSRAQPTEQAESRQWQNLRLRFVSKNPCAHLKRTTLLVSAPTATAADVGGIQYSTVTFTLLLCTGMHIWASCSDCGA